MFRSPQSRQRKNRPDNRRENFGIGGVSARIGGRAAAMEHVILPCPVHPAGGEVIDPGNAAQGGPNRHCCCRQHGGCLGQHHKSGIHQPRLTCLFQIQPSQLPLTQAATPASSLLIPACWEHLQLLERGIFSVIIGNRCDGPDQPAVIAERPSAAATAC